MKKANKRAIHTKQSYKRRDGKKQVVKQSATILPNPEEDESNLVRACNWAMKKPVSELAIEEVRLLISQSIKLDEVIPLAIGHLKNNILTEAVSYPGDLLEAILRSDPEYWTRNTENWRIVMELYTPYHASFENDTSLRKVRRNFENFEKISVDEKR